MSIKDIATENGIIHLDEERLKAPIEAITKEELVPVYNRIAAIIPNSGNMSPEQLTTISQECILFRWLPGHDVHYFVNGGKLCRVLDYKYLKSLSLFREQLISDDSSADIEESYRPLSAEEKAIHGIPDSHFAAQCTIVTKRERQQFTQQIKELIDMGFTVKDAVSVAKEMFGELGTTAIGVVPGNKVSPEGWSPMQKAEKLAGKNALNRRYGLPTVDEMMAMARRRAAIAIGQDWKPERADQPMQIQARYADLEATKRRTKEKINGMTDDERQANFARNVSMLRGPEDDDFIEAEFSEPEPQPEPEPTRPYTPDQLKDRIATLAAQYGNGTQADDALKQKARLALVNVSLGDDDTRHRLTEFLTRKASSNDLTKGEATAIIKWIDTTKDPESGEWLPSGHAVQEAKAVLKMLDEAQQPEAA